jgi:uncharacterized membrane protein YeaQ/YmgE (transglycosylase-associated protein family)
LLDASLVSNRSAWNMLRFAQCGPRYGPGGGTMGILGWIVFGLIVGALAKLVMPGRDPGGFIVTTLLGIVGAVLGGFIGRALGLYGPDEPAGFVMAFIGAIVLLFLYRVMVRRTA